MFWKKKYIDWREELMEEGIVELSFLKKEDVERCLQLYASVEKMSAKLQFHSTMFIKEPENRKIIDEKLSEILQPYISKYFPDFELLFFNFIVKESGSDTKVGIHQDWNFTTPEYKSLNIWIPLVDIHAKNGLFYGYKKSHKIFNNIRYTPYENNRYEPFKQDILKKSNAYRPKAGNALFYDGALIHFSDPNISGKIRIAVGCALVEKNAPLRHYYQPESDKNTIHVYAVDKSFYHGFDFSQAPVGYPVVDIIDNYKPF